MNLTREVLRQNTLFTPEQKKATSHGCAATPPLQRCHALPQGASPGVQRAPSCTCGGSCPRCQINPSVAIEPPHGSVQRQSNSAAASATRAGGDAPVPIRPLTPGDRAVDLQAERFKDDARLQDAFDNDPPLRFGARGPAVEKLQQALLDLGYWLPKSTKATGEPDGVFGQETTLMVKGFQWQQGIVKDGIVGRQTLGELDGLFTGQTPPGTPASGPDVPGEPITVSTVDRSPKQFGNCGGFTWGVDWVTNARNGYLVQEVNRTFKVTKECAPVPPSIEFTPRYFEAWRVQQDGGIHGASGPDDDWFNPSFGERLEGFPQTSGNWAISGRVYFVNQLDPAAGFKVRNVPDAGSLWSTTTQPTNLGTLLLDRNESDSWNCCDGATVSKESPGSTEGIRHD